MKKLIYGLLVCLIIVTGIVVFTFDKEESGNSKNPGSSSGSKGESHICYICGESGNMKYGSHYYCATHWAMVKTVAEAD